jgi:hypothetical protein
MKKIITILFIIAAPVIYFYMQGEPPVSSGQDNSMIDYSKDPIQEEYKTKDVLTTKNDDVEFQIYPVAKYKIAAVVASKKNYNSSWNGWEGKLAPIDLALIWGKLPSPEYRKYIRYSQSSRFYFYRYELDSPVDKGYIGPHSSNHHIIPANDNIYRALKKLEEDQSVELDGYLVNIKGVYKGRDIWWNSSLTRTDSGDGACELFYVTKIRFGGNIYQ